MKIYLTRHGQTEWNLKGIIQGTLDSPLTEKGIKDGKKLSKKLRNVKFDLAYTSTQHRAVHTTEIITNKKVEIIKLDELREIGVGSWEGMLYEDIQTKHSQQFKLYKYFPHLYIPNNGGEDYNVFEQRVRSFIEILISNKKENVLVVTHGLTYLLLLNIFEDKELKNLPERSIPLGTSLTIIEYKNGQFNIMTENDFSHLD